MKTRTRFGFAAASLIVIAGSANATTIGHFAPAGAAGGNLNGYVGTGISNDNMVLDGGSGISLGIKSQHRFNGDWADATDAGDRAIYRALPGVGEVTGEDIDPTGRATTWDYLYAIDFGTAVSESYGLRLMLDFDAAIGEPAAYVTIEQAFGTGLEKTGDSQSMGFSFWDGLATIGTNAPVTLGGVTYTNAMFYQQIDPNEAGHYDVRFEVYELASGDIVAEAAMTVVVVPLPPAAWAGLAGLAGAAVMRRRFTT